MKVLTRLIILSVSKKKYPELPIVLLTPLASNVTQRLEHAECPARCRCCCCTKTALTPESMYPLRNRSITIRHTIMRRCGNPLPGGTQTKIPISPLSKISCPPSICATRDWTSGLRWCMARRSRKRPVGGDRSEQPDPAFQSRDLQDPTRCQPHDRGGRPRRHGQNRLGKTNRLRTSDEIY